METAFGEYPAIKEAVAREADTERYVVNREESPNTCTFNGPVRIMSTFGAVPFVHYMYVDELKFISSFEY